MSGGCPSASAFTRQHDPVKIERDLQRLVPKEDWARFPHLLIWHGRRVCIARAPSPRGLRPQRSLPVEPRLGSRRAGRAGRETAPRRARRRRGSHVPITRGASECSRRKTWNAGPSRVRHPWRNLRAPSLLHVGWCGPSTLLCTRTSCCARVDPRRTARAGARASTARGDRGADAAAPSTSLSSRAWKHSGSFPSRTRRPPGPRSPSSPRACEPSKSFRPGSSGVSTPSARAHSERGMSATSRPPSSS